MVLVISVLKIFVNRRKYKRNTKLQKIFYAINSSQLVLISEY